MENKGTSWLLHFSVAAMLAACVGISGCNRHQAHDDDEDTAAPVKAAGATGDDGSNAVAATAEKDSSVGVEEEAKEAPPASASTPASASAGEEGDKTTSEEATASASSETVAAEAAKDSSTPASEAAPTESTESTPAEATEAASADASSKDGSAESSSAAPGDVKHKPASTSREHGKAKPASTASIFTAWWAPSASAPLSVRAVGPAADRSAMVVVLSKDVDSAAVSSHLHLTLKGKPVKIGVWQAGANQHVLVRMLTPGIYTLRIDGRLASADGAALGMDLKGAVIVN